MFKMPAFSEPFAGSAKTILAVEDDPDIATFLVEVISTETPWRVLLAPNAVQALQIVNTLIPDLLLLDYLLPGMSGIELFHRFQTMEHLQGVPALLMSAHLPKHMKDRWHLAFLEKPFALDALLTTIEQLLAPRSSGQYLHAAIPS